MNSISVHFYCIFFVSILYSIICIQYLFISRFDHLYLIINDLYAIVFHYNSMTSINIPYFFIFIIYNYICIV